MIPKWWLFSSFVGSVRKSERKSKNAFVSRMSCGQCATRTDQRRHYSRDICEIEGIIYEDGEPIPTGDHCLECHCTPHEPQLVKCMATACAFPMCVDPEYYPGGCCLVCPNGRCPMPCRERSGEVLCHILDVVER